MDPLQIFSSTPVVQPAKAVSQFQSCKFPIKNSVQGFKSIFRGKAVVQPAKPFFVNPRFTDHRGKSFQNGVPESMLNMKFPPIDKGCNKQNWQSFSSYEVGETSKRVMQRFPKKRDFKNYRWDITNSNRFHLRQHLQNRNNWKSSHSSSGPRHFDKQPILDICYGTPPGSPTHILNAKSGIVPNEVLGKEPVKPLPNSNRVSFNPKKQRLVWRKKSCPDSTTHEIQQPKIDHLSITFPSHMLQESIRVLRQSALIGKINSDSIDISDIKQWAFKNWIGVKDVFYIDQQSQFFVAIFESKEDRDCVHRFKGWFCLGYGLYTMIWIPNFNPESLEIHFYPFWISFPQLPLEYRDPNIIEVLANKIGIFLKHDLIPYDRPHLSVRVCVLLDMRKNIPPNIQINSTWGLWNQPILVQNSDIIQRFQSTLGHFNTQCLNGVQDSVKVCSDHTTDPKLCTFQRLTEDPQISAEKVPVVEDFHTPHHDTIPDTSTSFVQDKFSDVMFSYLLKILMPSVLCLMEHFDKNVIVPFKRDALITYHLNIPNTLSLLPIQPSDYDICKGLADWKTCQIEEQIVSEIASKIMFDIAVEEGFPGVNHNKKQLDDLLEQYQFWFHKSSHCLQDSKKSFVTGNISDVIASQPEEDIIIANDPLGIEESIYNNIQDSVINQSYVHEETDLGQTENNKDSLQDQTDEIPLEICLDLYDYNQTLSIAQSTSLKQQVIKTPKSRGRPKGSKTRIEIASGIQTTLDDKFVVSKRVTRRTKGSPCPQ
jgi:hypothetical protein